MKMNIFLVIIYFLFLNCTPQKNIKNNLEVVAIHYNKDSIPISEFKYSLNGGVLIRQFNKVKVVLSEDEKQDMFRFYQELKIKNNAVCVKFEDGYSTQISIAVKESKILNEKCSQDKNEIEKHLLFFAKIRNLLKTKEDYKNAFPAEFESY